MAKNEIEPQKSFQERIKDRIKEDIGKLMTDEELSAIVSRSVEDIFFANRRVQRAGGFSGYEEAPPFIHELLRELMADNLRKCVDDWMRVNKKEVLKIINDVVERGMVNAVTRVFEAKFETSMINFMNNVQQNLVP